MQYNRFRVRFCTNLICFALILKDVTHLGFRPNDLAYDLFQRLVKDSITLIYLGMDHN